MRPPQNTLEKLYLVDRLTTRAIGARFGVSKTEVLRWLIRDRIPRRGAGRNRGIIPPTRDELDALLNEQHLSYREIGAHYGMSTQPVVDWIRRYGLQRSTVWGTRRRGRTVAMPTPGQLRSYYADGLSLEHIGELHGVSAQPVRDLADRIGLAIKPNGWKQGKRWPCADGHSARSTFEMRVDNWLHEHSILHRPEPRIPRTTYWRADFWADGWYVEIWGVINRPSYRQRKQEKQAHYRRHGIPLFELTPSDFSAAGSDRWQRKLATTFLDAPHRSHRVRIAS